LLSGDISIDQYIVLVTEKVYLEGEIKKLNEQCEYSAMLKKYLKLKLNRG
jgi:hypothetical protein